MTSDDDPRTVKCNNDNVTLTHTSETLNVG